MVTAVSFGEFIAFVLCGTGWFIGFFVQEFIGRFFNTFLTNFLSFALTAFSFGCIIFSDMFSDSSLERLLLTFILTEFSEHVYFLCHCFYSAALPFGTVSAMSYKPHSNASQIRRSTSVVTFSSFPNLARDEELIPAALRKSDFFISLSISSFHSFL